MERRKGKREGKHRWSNRFGPRVLSSFERSLRSGLESWPTCVRKLQRSEVSESDSLTAAAVRKQLLAKARRDLNCCCCTPTLNTRTQGWKCRRCGIGRDFSKTHKKGVRNTTLLFLAAQPLCSTFSSCFRRIDPQASKLGTEFLILALAATLQPTTVNFSCL